MLYRILRFIIGLGIRIYYKEVRIKNSRHLEHNGPMIIIANHPNTLMDAWMVGYACNSPIYFMAKASFFNSRIKRKILSSLNMIPINRANEAKIEGVNNRDSFEACYNLLEQNKKLVIFPEGNSFAERKLRPLKSGTARIALEAEYRNGGKLNLKIVPLGLFYSQAEKFRSSVLITVGKGIDVIRHIELYKTQPSIASKQLTERLRVQMEHVLYTVENQQQEKFIETIHQLIIDNPKSKNIEDNAKLFGEIKHKIEELTITQPYKIQEIQNIVNKIEWQRKQLNLQVNFVNRKFRYRLYLMQICISLVFLVLGLPAFIFGLIHNIIPYKLTDKLVPKITKEVEYFAALGVLISFVLYPITYFIALSIAKNYFDLGFVVQCIYFFLMPISGLFAFKFVKWLRHNGNKWSYIFLIFKQKESLEELQMQLKLLGQLLELE